MALATTGVRPVGRGLKNMSRAFSARSVRFNGTLITRFTFVTFIGLNFNRALSLNHSILIAFQLLITNYKT